VERIREVVTGSVDLDYVRQKTEAGWKLVAMEWRREIAGDEAEQPIIVEDIPCGLRVASDSSRLEEDPQERAVLVRRPGPDQRAAHTMLTIGLPVALWA